MRRLLRPVVVVAALLWSARAFGADAPSAFADIVRGIEDHRADLGRRYRTARGRERSEILRESRTFILRALRAQILPAWSGTPWGLGRNANAAMPAEPGKVVSCNYFTVSALANAGLRLGSRARFAEVPALWLHRALLPAVGRIRRYADMSPEALGERLVRELGDGLYLLGLRTHIGFLVVQGAEVRFVHASYTAPFQVVDEPLRSSAAISFGRHGFTVSPLFQDDRMVDLWLRHAPVPPPPRFSP